MLAAETVVCEAAPRRNGRAAEIEHLVDLEAGTYTRLSRGHDRRRRTRSRLFARPFAAGSSRASRRPTDGAGRGLGGHRARRAHAHPRADGEWQDPGRVPVRPGPARPTIPSPPPTRDDPGPGPGPLRLPAQGADLRRRAQPAGPADGDRLAAERLGGGPPRISVASRTGDTPAEDRREIARRPPDILITTPESLYLLLTSQGARDPARRRVRHHRRGPRDRRHQARRAPRPQPGAPRAPRARRRHERRPSGSGCRATQRPLEAIARFLGGVGPDREVTIVDAGARKPLELQVVVRSRTWPRSARSCRRAAARRPGDQPGPADEHLAGDPPADPRADPRAIAARSSSPTAAGSASGSPSGSTSWPARSSSAPITAASPASSASQIEEELKAGRLPALVATSSLELGIDMGAVDLVIQVESPTSVARGLQRVGRAGHQVGAPSKGVIFPKYRGDLLEVAVVTRRMHEGAIEATAPAQPARRPRPAARRDDRHGPLDGRRPARDASPRGAVRDADPRGLRRRPRHARRRLSVRRVRRAQAARRLGPRHRHDRGPAGRAGRRRHERRHDPGPRPVRRVHGRRGRARPAGASASSTRRWSTSAAGCTATSSSSARAAGGSRRSATTGSRSARRPACRASCRSGRATRSAGRSSSAGRWARSSARWRATSPAATAGRATPQRTPARAARPRRAGRREPAVLPRGRARGDRRPADRQAGRRRALPRRARRLAARAC